MSKEETALLAKFRKRSKSSYEKVKEVEAKAGGRELPLGLEGAICQITGLKITEDKNGVGSVYVYRSGIEPKQIEGIAMGQNYPIEETHYNYGSGVQTEEENQARLTVDLKLMGYEEQILTHDDFFTMLSDVAERVEQDKPFVFFNTGKKASKSGEARVYLQGVVPADYNPPEMSEENKHEETHQPAKKKTVVKKGTSFSENDKVKTVGDYFEDGNEYTGTVLGSDGDSITVEFDDGSGSQEIPAESLALVETKKATPTKKSAPVKKAAPKKGIRPQFEENDAVVSTEDYFGNGEDYNGTIISVDGETATVTWEDDTTNEAVPFKNLKPAQ